MNSQQGQRFAASFLKVCQTIFGPYALMLKPCYLSITPRLIISTCLKRLLIFIVLLTKHFQTGV